MADLLERLRSALGDRYRIERTLGQGGMAVVYLAEDLKHHRRVAIKVLKAELATAVGAERFLREVTVAAGLDHPHIVPVHDSGEADGLLYYVMPYIDGESLRERLTREKQLRVGDAVQIAREVADALSFAHSRGVVHRDVKPENILLAGGHARVADFGIARAISVAGGEHLTETGFVVGTPAYMSPEQATGRRDLDARSDIYSLGAVLYEMIRGEPPHAGGTANAIIARLLSEEPGPLRTVRVPVPRGLEAAVMKALAKVPADRYSSAAEFSHAVRLSEPPDGRSRQRRRVVAAGALTAVGLGGALAAKLLLGPSERRAAIRGRPPVQVTTTGIAEGPVFSPDGRAIAYSQLGQPGVALLIRDPDGGEASIFTSPRGRAVYAPRWSPSGLRILFHDRSSLSVISRLGGEPTRFSMADGLLVEAADFGADDSSFVLALRTRGAGHWLYIGSQPRDVRAVGPDSLSGPGLLVHLRRAVESLMHVPGGIVGLRVSPNRRWAAFISVPGLDSGTITVGTLALDGTRGYVVAQDSGDLRAYNRGATQLPSWSPEGDWIYYARHSRSEATVMRVLVDSRSGRRKRSAEVVFDRLPRNLNFDVSPDGRRLAYSAGPFRASLYLWSWEAGGGRINWTDKLVRGTSSYRAGRIAPDGAMIAYVKADDFDQTGDLYVRPLPDGPERLVARAVRPPIGWSPDGKWLGFFKSRGLGLMLANLQTGRVRQIGIRFGFPSAGLSWSPDGRTLTYATIAGAIVLHDTAGSMVEVPSFGGKPWMAAYAHPVFAPDGRRVAMFRPEGLWVHEIDSGRASLVESGWLFPQRWTPDGWIYVIRSSATAPRTALRIERVPAAGGQSQIVAESPDLQDCDELALTPHGNTALCTRVEPSTDIWLRDLIP